MFITNRVRIKIVYGFVISSVLLLVMGAVAYSGLSKIKQSFEILDESISRQVLSIEEIRSNYSFLLLEMTTFLLLDFNDQDKDAELARIGLLKNEFSKSVSSFSDYFIGHDKPKDFSKLEDAENRSLELINRIVELRKQNKPLAEILPLKRNLKQIESEDFFPVIDEMIRDNKLKIESERRAVKATSKNTLFALMVVAAASALASFGMGYAISSREELVDRFKDQLISIASHQLKTPMTVMKGNIELLSGGNNLSEPQKNIVSDLKRGTENLTRTISDFLDLSRIEEGRFKLEPEKVSFCDLVSSAVTRLRGFAEETKVVLNFVRPDKDFYVLVDESRMKQAINNTIDNAIKYSKSGGEVRIAITEEKETALLSVKDSGIGIPEHDQKMIFEKFFRASNTAGKQGGSGLGLFLVKIIIEQSRGKIWFETKEGAGTTFFVRLPKYV